MSDLEPKDSKNAVRLYENMTERQRYACYYFLRALESEFFHTAKRLREIETRAEREACESTANYWENNAMAMRLAMFRLGVSNKGIIEYADQCQPEYTSHSASRRRTIAVTADQSRGDDGGIEEDSQ